ncbi:2Fe-2S iron-sulfur cluster-binding protein [Calothrix sp. 336/3]|uniref:2Fe-2S iron-sulfur cluster-binding protein n=1 Tax=Calothrix sp. 336/3 TaxID=1337936 RepID=UPI0004E2DE99|nr:2Fe-2S iron-sulfur cluster-binding protein [Calothrix sp. 336/3]AKG22795.1 ferredoxin [Calothrix sp. 336/3]
MKQYTITFTHSHHPPLKLAEYQLLSEHLTVENSPLLFGCRTGICGTCLIEVSGNISPATEEETEVLEILAPGNKKARLACQIQVTGDMEICRI